MHITRADTNGQICFSRSDLRQPADKLCWNILPTFHSRSLPSNAVLQNKLGSLAANISHSTRTDDCRDSCLVLAAEWKAWAAGRDSDTMAYSPTSAPRFSYSVTTTSTCWHNDAAGPFSLSTESICADMMRVVAINRRPRRICPAC